MNISHSDDTQQQRTSGESELPASVGKQPLALIMKGGSVKGLAYVGALKELEKYYRFDRYVGTSAGAIAAVLLAAGYTTGELEKILSEKNFRDFLDARVYRWPINLILYKGIFPADTLTDWLDKLLAAKLQRATRVRLCDLPHRVTIYASRRGDETLVFDSDDPERKNTPAAFAVRCSLTIPYVFMPQTDQGIRVLDGGLRNNYPVKALLSSQPDAKFLGLYLGPRIYEGSAGRDRRGLLISELLSIWTESSDLKALQEYPSQTIIIDPRPISTLSFRLTAPEKSFLISAGQAAALDFLASQLRASGVTKEDAGKVQDEVEQQRTVLRRKRTAKRRRTIAASIALLLLLAGGGVFAFISNRAHAQKPIPILPDPSKPKVAIEPSPCPLTLKETRLNTLSLSDWIGSSGKWIVDRDIGNAPTGKLHIVQTDGVAYSKSQCLRNFYLTFNIEMESDDGAAWALRVKDARNYYLFCLFGPNGVNPNQFCAYVVRDGEFDIENPIDPSDVVAPVKRGAQFVIRIDVQDDEIKHTLNPSNLDLTTQGRDLLIHIFKEADKDFHYGSVGFRAIGSQRFSIGNVVVRPIDLNVSFRTESSNSRFGVGLPGYKRVRGAQPC